jgi:hypothetical protein
LRAARSMSGLDEISLCWTERVNARQSASSSRFTVAGADLYARSSRVYRGLEDLMYPFHDHTIIVTHCGRMCFKAGR